MKSELTSFAGLELLSSAVIALNHDGVIVYANVAAENLLETSFKILSQQTLREVFLNGGELGDLFEQAMQQEFADKRVDLVLERIARAPLPVHVIFTALDRPDVPVLVEMHKTFQQIRQGREERLLDQTQANKELIRNLAHEIKNPLGGIRGAAQLLEMEFAGQDFMKEYTQVIIKEAGRLQTLVDRLLAPHRHPHVVGEVNIHEVCEHVRRLVVAEFPAGMKVVRDYDLSIPEFLGDREQLIQALLNIVHNAALALAERRAAGDAELVLRTRIARQVTIAKVRYRLALDLHIIDNGPGISPDIMDRIFFPLVTGRDGGSGLGLTLAQTFVQQHGGMIDCDSQPGRTDFRILIPLE